MRRLVVRALALILVAVAVLAGTLAWRLARGPIRLDVLTPRLEAALSRPGGPLAVRIGDTALAWEPARRDVVLRLRDVVVTAAATGARVGVVPVLFVRLSARALLGGRIAVRRVTLLGPDVRLVRQHDGTVDLGLGDAIEPVGDDLTLAELVDGVFGPQDVGRGVRLRAVGVESGRVELVDLASGRAWRMPRVDATVRPDGDGVAGSLHGLVAMPAGPVPVDVQMRYTRSPEQVALTIDVRGLVPAHIQGAPPLATRLALPLDGTVALTWDGALRLTRVRATVTSGRGSIDVAGTPLPVTRVAGTLDADVAAGVVQLDDVVAEVDGATLGARGRLAGDAVDVEARLSRLAVTALPRWWPATIAAAGRRWVLANVTAGHVRDVALRCTGTMRHGDPATFAPGAVTGAGSFEGLTVRFLDAMPPATAVGGTMTLATDGLGFRVARGSVSGVDVVRATVDVPLGAAAPRRVPIAASVRGPLAAALAVLDAPPVALARALGVTAADARGVATGTVTLAVPLDGRATARALGVRVTAEVRDGGMPRLVRGLALSSADLAITRDDTMLAVRGPLRLGGVPATIVWQEDQTGTAATRRRVDVRARVDDAGWTALGVETHGVVRGAVTLRADYVEPRAGQASVALDGDLAAATVRLAVLDVHKPAGRPGRAGATVLLRDGMPVTIERLAVRAGDSRIDGRATRSGDGTRWVSADLTADVAPSGPGETAHRFTLALRPGGARNRFTVTCDDAGALFRGMGSYGDAEGGRLTATGTVDLAAAGPPFDAEVEVRSFRLTREPVVTRVAQLTSLSGIVSSLRGGGLAFDRMACRLSQRGHVVTVADGVADGPSLAFTMSGTVDRAAGTMAMTGTLVPAYYGLNTAAGRIPVLGRLLAGGDRAGFQVFDFTARGPMENPTVTANVSSLAPGVLRDLVRRLTR